MEEPEYFRENGENNSSNNGPNESRPSPQYTEEQNLRRAEKVEIRGLNIKCIVGVKTATDPAYESTKAEGC